MSGWRSVFLRAFPTLAVCGSWLSLSFPQPGPVYVFRIVAIAVLPVLITSWLKSSHQSNSLVRWLVTLASVTLFWGLLSQFWAADALNSLVVTISVTLAILSALSVLLAVQQTSRGMEKLSQGLLIALGFLWALGGLQLVSGLSLSERVGRPWLFGEFLAGPFDNPNNFAVYLAGCAVPLISKLAFPGNLLIRVLATSGLLVTVYFVAETGSRAGLALMLMVVVVVVMARIFREPVTLGYAFIIVAVTVSALATWVWNSSETLYVEYVYSGQQESDLLRLLLVQKGFEYLTSSFGSGVGAGQFESRLQQDGIAVTNAHNVFIEYVAEFGLPAVLLMVYSIMVVAVAYFRSGATADLIERSNVLGVGLAYSCVIVIAGLVTSSSMEEPIWWVLIAALAASFTTGRDSTHFQLRTGKKDRSGWEHNEKSN